MVCALDVSSDPVMQCAGVCDKVFHTRCIKDDIEGRTLRSNRDWMSKECRNACSTSSAQSAHTILTKDFLVLVMEQFKQEVFNGLKVFQTEMSFG